MNDNNCITDICYRLILQTFGTNICTEFLGKNWWVHDVTHSTVTDIRYRQLVQMVVAETRSRKTCNDNETANSWLHWNISPTSKIAILSWLKMLGLCGALVDSYSRNSVSMMNCTQKLALWTRSASSATLERRSMIEIQMHQNQRFQARCS